MNPERLFQEVARRLHSQPQSVREEVMDALREELARERRRSSPISTVQNERLRRMEAEALRNVLEAMNRSTELSDTVDEVLRQARSLLTVDSCAVAVNDPSGGVRIIGALGYPEDSNLVGLVRRSPLCDAIRETRQPIAVDDVHADPRWEPIASLGDLVRSWAGVPLLVEGDMIGLLSLDRHSLAPFDEDEIRRAKTLTFSAAAALRRADLLEKLRRYSGLLERSLDVDQAVFSGQAAERVARVILDGAMKLGHYPGGLLLLVAGSGMVVASGSGTVGGVALEKRQGQAAPAMLLGPGAARIEAPAAEHAALFGVAALQQPLLLVPLIANERPVGALLLIDPNGETPDDRLLAAYASRAAAACLYSRTHA
jgi:hypothetical protein